MRRLRESGRSLALLGNGVQTRSGISGIIIIVLVMIPTVRAASLLALCSVPAAALGDLSFTLYSNFIKDVVQIRA